MTTKRALVLGANGQDGSYLCDLLLEKDYIVIGALRRSSTPNDSNIKHLYSNENFTTVEFDICDIVSIANILDSFTPDEIYNTSAQSHVRTSFEQPINTFRVDGEGVLNVLECMRRYSPKAKLLQCSTSEMLGNSVNKEGFQDMETPFMPQSPYSAAKLAAHHLCRIYREGYGLFACCSITFNHETMCGEMPIIFKDSDGVNIKPISEVVKKHTGVVFDESKMVYQAGQPTRNLYVWDGDWTKVTYVSGYPHNIKDDDKRPKIINSRYSAYAATSSHECVMANDASKATEDIVIGDRIKLIDLLEDNDNEDFIVDEYEAELLGMIVGDGRVGDHSVSITGSDIKNQEKVKELWGMITPNGYCSYYPSKSGFTGEVVGRLSLVGDVDWIRDFDIYTDDKKKRVPQCILNANRYIQQKFLEGYNRCDGLKSNLCKYEFKNFKTNSSTLAMGLLFLINRVTGQKYNITVEETYKWGDQRIYYSINLLSDQQTSLEKWDLVSSFASTGCGINKIVKHTGVSECTVRRILKGQKPKGMHPREKPHNEVKKIIDLDNYDGWFYDLETESGKFHAGIGCGLVHNSPRRGEKFVTRKVTKFVADLHRCLMTPFGYENLPVLYLGNIEAQRDWGHASDMVRGFHLMLQQDEPDDYILATGETYSVKDLLTCAFDYIGIPDYSKYVDVDSDLYRPAEVHYLKGDASKAREALGWEPEYNFQELIHEMIESDINSLQGERVQT